MDGKGESGPRHKVCQLGTPAVMQPVKYLLKKDMLCNINSVLLIMFFFVSNKASLLEKLLTEQL